MRQVVSAVNYLHELKIVHRDLKLDNILLNYESEIDKNQMNLFKSEIKIVDFGFATHMTSAKLLTSAIGSPFNMDPRILKKFTSGRNNLQRYDEKADIWSLGALCYKMLTGENPFYAESVQELASKVEEGTFKVPISFARETISFLLGMLQYDSSQRLSAKELMNHPFLIKNVEDFSYIDLRKVTHKMKYDDLYINIKENQTIFSLVNVVNKEGENQFNINPNDLFPIETGSLYLFNSNEPDQIRPKDQKENTDINSELTYNTYSEFNNISDFSNNNGFYPNNYKYGLDNAEMVNSTIFSPSLANNLTNMEKKDPVIGELLEMKMPQEQRVLLNSLIHINYFPSQVWKSAPQPEEQ
jgi:serine/threonine protein kinase